VLSCFLAQHSSADRHRHKSAVRVAYTEIKMRRVGNRAGLTMGFVTVPFLAQRLLHKC